MIFQSQAIERILTESGQVAVDPADLGLDSGKISRAIFVPAVREYSSRHRPRKERTIVRSANIDANGIIALPDDFAQLTQVKPIGPPHLRDIAEEYDYFLPNSLGERNHLFRTVPEMGIDYRVDTTKKEIILPGGTFSISYLSNCSPTRKVEDWLIEDTDLGGTDFRFYVPPEVASQFTLTILGRDFAIDLEAAPGEEVTPAATNLNDPVEIDSFASEFECGALYIDITTSKDAIGGICLSATATYPCAPVLSYAEDELFFLMFLVRFGHAYANAKALLPIDEVDIDFSRDDFLQWVRQKETEYQRLLESDQKWWASVG